MFRVFPGDLRDRPKEEEINRDHSDRLMGYFLDEEILKPLVEESNLYLLHHPDANKVADFVRGEVEKYIFLREQKAVALYHKSGLDFMTQNSEATTDEIIAHMEDIATARRLPEASRTALFRYIIGRILYISPQTPTGKSKTTLPSISEAVSVSV